MKILGISNPGFQGVTFATQAITEHYLGVPPVMHTSHIKPIIAKILKYEPDVLVVGGWSDGYGELLAELKKVRKFPVLGVYHSTPFHGVAFGDDVYLTQFHASHKKGDLDLIGFVHPPTAEYYQKIKKVPALFVPHAFEVQDRTEDAEYFRIGIFGGLTKNFYKNTAGAHAVARSFCERNEDCEIIAPANNDIPHEEFLKVLSRCSVVIQVSHLECYSNTIQEAWARGIPAIIGPANDGLTVSNPLLDGAQMYALGALSVNCSTDPMELYKAIERSKKHWLECSQLAHESYKVLAHRTKIYLDIMYHAIVTGFRHTVYDTDFFRSPFSKNGLDWTRLEAHRNKIS